MSKKKDRGYVRVSTMKDSQKDSPEHQMALLREHTSRQGIELDHIYEDRDTATSIMARDDVQRMIKDAKRGEIRSIWFPSLSRFSRDALDALSLKRTLVNALKVRVVSIEDGYDSAVKDDEVLFGVKSVINQNQSEQTSIASRRGKRQSAASGNFTGSVAPYGYKKVKEGKKKSLVVIPEQAQIVKMIFSMYLSGLGEKEIVKYLNGENPKNERFPTAKGGPWGITSIQRILTNEHYTGHVVHGKYTVETAYNDLNDLMNRGKKLIQKPKEEWERTPFQTHEQIISYEDFAKAQEIRLQRGGGVRGGRRSFVNVFAKIIFCAECGAAMVTMSAKNKKEDKEYKYRYLMCSRRRRMGDAGCKNSKWVPYYEMRDELIAEILRQIRARVRELESKGTNDIVMAIPGGDFEKEKRKLKKRIEDNRKLLFEIRRQNMLGELDPKQYEFEKEQYEKEIAEAENRLMLISMEEQKQLDIERLMHEAKKSLNELSSLKTYDDVEQTRMLLLQVVRRIEVDKDAEIYIQLNI